MRKGEYSSTCGPPIKPGGGYDGGAVQWIPYGGLYKPANKDYKALAVELKPYHNISIFGIPIYSRIDEDAYVSFDPK